MKKAMNEQFDINKVFNDLLVYVQEDGTVLPVVDGSVYSNNTHNKLFNDYIIGSGLLNGSFNPEDGMIANASKLAVNNKFIMFCNMTTYKDNNDKCDSVLIYSSLELTDSQRSIINECYDHFKSMGFVVAFVFDNNGIPKQCFLDDYMALVNPESKKLVRK